MSCPMATETEKVDQSKVRAASNGIVRLNVGGKRMSTSRQVLTQVEGTVLAQLFADRPEKKEKEEEKEANDEHFLDYDPQLFGALLGQLRSWCTNPLSTRVFPSSLTGENEFVTFVRCLGFEERHLTETFAETNQSHVRVLDERRLAIKTGDEQQCAFVTGHVHYFQGKHSIKLMQLVTRGEMGFIGIRPVNVPLEVRAGKNYLPVKNTFGVDNTCLVVNGEQVSWAANWLTLWPLNIFRLHLDCDSRSMTITRDQYQTSNDRLPVRFVDLTLAPLPWQLFIVLKGKNDYVRILF